MLGQIILTLDNVVHSFWSMCLWSTCVVSFPNFIYFETLKPHRVSHKGMMSVEPLALLPCTPGSVQGYTLWQHVRTLQSQIEICSAVIKHSCSPQCDLLSMVLHARSALLLPLNCTCKHTYCRKSVEKKIQQNYNAC